MLDIWFSPKLRLNRNWFYDDLYHVYYTDFYYAVKFRLKIWLSFSEFRSKIAICLGNFRFHFIKITDLSLFFFKFDNIKSILRVYNQKYNINMFDFTFPAPTWPITATRPFWNTSKLISFRHVSSVSLKRNEIWKKKLLNKCWWMVESYLGPTGW